MNEKKDFDKTMVSRAVISKIQDDRNPDMIKAKYINRFKDPDTIYRKKNEIGYKPDIIAFNKDNINIYEIELDDKMPLDKWELFSAYARKNNGNLYLVIPDYLKEKIKAKVKKENILTGLIYFDTK